MKKEKRILYRIAALLLGGIALIALATDGTDIPEAYRQFFGLTSTNTVLDLDSDSLNNLQESVLWTDPLVADTDKDGWSDNVDSNPVSRAVFMWGDAQFTSNEVYRYTFPAWCVDGFKTDGSWSTNGWVADNSLSNNTGALNIQVSRDLLTNNVTLDVELFDATDASLFVALCDTNQEIIVSNLYGQSIVTGSQAVVTRRLLIPFTSYTNAAIVRLWRGAGEINVHSSLMYIDEDGDGLDADQERQLGTSDYNADSDGDGLSDWAEVFVTHTNPLNTDSDNDGYSDYVEVMAGSNPNQLTSLPVSSVSVGGTVYYGGSETGSIRITADTYSNNWSSMLYQDIPAPGVYSLTSVPVLSNFWIRAWRDANGNGLCEPWEARGEHELNPRYFTHPVSNVDLTLSDYRQNYALPWSETFEAVSGMAGTPGNLNAQHGWNVSGTGTATVQSNTASGGMQALQVTEASVSHNFISGETNVWVSYRLKAGRGSAPQNIPTNMAVVFYVNGSGNLCVYSNQQSVTLPVTVPDGWNRFDFHCDYTAKRWDLRFNREKVVSNFAFYGSPAAFSVLRLDAGKDSYMDDVQVVFENPDRDDDGYTNDEETQAGTNPDDPQDIPGVTVSGTVTYSGLQTGTVYAVAVTGSDDWSLTKSADLNTAGTYSISNVRAGTNIWIKAWRDSNGNGLCDAQEARGVYGTNSLLLNNSTSGLNITLTDLDTDSDGLSDWWEIKYFTNLDQTASGNPDNDGLVNSNELTRLTNPTVADTDNDGWLDGEEVTRGSDPLNGLSIPVSRVTVSGTVGYAGRQTGTVHVVVATDAGAWNSSYAVTAAQPGSFSITNVPVFSNVWVKAWRDSDGNGSNGVYEASAVYSNNPLYLTRSVSNLVMTLVDPDTDSDGLSDWWEIKYFTNLDQTASGDADGDMLSNLEEYNYQTSPASADTDNDGLPDNWELANGLNPLNLADCMSDPDDDGFGVVYEYQHGTSGTNSADYPLVTTNVSPGQKIQDVIDASPDYSIIRIEPGAYSGSKNRDLHFDGKHIMLTAVPGTVVLNADSSLAIRSYSGGEDIRTVVDGLTIRGASQHAVYFSGAGLTLRNCLIEGNGNGTAAGAGLYVSGTAALVENCVFFQNFSTNGGAIYANTSDLQLRNCTLVSNRVAGTGGSIQFRGTGKTLTVLNSIIWEEGTNSIQMDSGLTNISYSCIKGGYAGTGNITNNPQVLSNGYYLGINSPCIDAGTTAGAPSKDIEGHGRTGAMDIGAWEYNASYADSDNDGYTDAQEAGISNPQDAQSLPVSEVTVSGAVTYSGPQTGTVCVVAVTASNDWSLTIGQTLSAPGSYSIGNVPVLSTIWIKAWRDSNGNGLCDTWEAQGVYSADPLYLRLSTADINVVLNDPDNDGDGLPDWRELELGTNPYLADTDGDGLSDADEIGSVYRIVNGAFTWDEAKADAERRGGHLVTLSNEAEHQKLVRFVGESVFTNASYWIGAYRSDTNSADWQWVTGEEFLFTRWSSFSVTEEPWAHYEKWRHQFWSNTKIWGGCGYILEIENFGDPLLSDTDGDGLNDGQELAYGCNARTVDSDGDGLLDGDEVSRGLNPDCADSDHDGLSDALELTLGTNPLLADTDGDGLSDYDEVNFRYQLSRRYLTWNEARLEAERRGGHLAVVTSDEESEKICKLLDVNSALWIEYPWIGASRTAPGAEWTWVTQEPFSYTLWSEWAEFLDEQDAVCYAGKSWDAVYRETRKPWILESETALNPLNPDVDGDGLLDGDEIARGTDPFCADTDGDGLSDYAEVYTYGTNPLDPDSDRDGLSDAQELALGMNPLLVDMDGDGLLDGEEVLITGTDPLLADSNSNSVPDCRLILSMPGSQTFERYSSHISSTWSELEDGRLALDNIRPHEYEASYAVYKLPVEQTDGYRFAVQCSWLTERSNELDDLRIDLYVDGQLVASMPVVQRAGALPESFCYIPRLTAGTHTFKLLPHGRTSKGDKGIVMDAVELYAMDGADADNDGIQDWIEALLAQGKDTDGDGISDYDEIFTYGTEYLCADTDKDGLKDGAELLAGTNPLNPDSDGDGVKDGVEINEIHTDALVPKFDGTVTNALVLPGSATNSVTGSWTNSGSSIRSVSRRGELQYLFTLPTQDMYRVEIEAAHLWKSTLGSPEQIQDTSTFDFYVDGIYVSSHDLVALTGTVATVQAFLPVLAPGQHTLTVFWENLNRQLGVEVKELRFQQLGGPDANHDGIKDWVAESLFNSTSVDSPLQSVVSPICLEGAARYPELATIASSLQPQVSSLHRGAGDRWYADVALDPSGQTPVSVSFQNGAFTRTVQAEWTAFNMLQSSQSNLTIRVGDSVKLTALPQGWHGGQFKLSLNGQESNSPNCRPLIYTFDQAGTYVISGEYRHGNQTTAGQMTVTVVDWTFTGEEPACMVGSEREWTVSDLPVGAVIETDPSVAMEIVCSSLITNNQSQITASLLASEANGTHAAVVRLYEGGPVMASIPVKTFWVESGVDHYMRVVERYADNQLWETTTVAKHLPADVNVLIDVFAAGVTLDDYTIARTLTANDFSSTGEYTFRLFHPNDRTGSTCYNMEVYQTDRKIGETR